MAKTQAKLVNIIAEMNHLEEVLDRLIGLSDFYPEPAAKLADSVHGLTTLVQENFYKKMMEQLKSLLGILDMDVQETEDSSAPALLDHPEELIEKIQADYTDIQSKIEEIAQLKKEDEEIENLVKPILDLEISLDEIFACEYMVSRLGKLPLDSAEKLEEYKSKPFIWTALSKDFHHCWGIYMTTNSYEREVDNLFSSLHFERIHIPHFIHGTPEEALEGLTEEMKSFQRSLDKLNLQKEELRQETKEKLSELYLALAHASLVFEARKFVLVLGNRFSISGFILPENMDSVTNAFQDLPFVEIEVRPASSDKRLTPPTKMKTKKHFTKAKTLADLFKSGATH